MTLLTNTSNSDTRPYFIVTNDKNSGEVTRVQLHIPSNPVGKIQISSGEVISLTVDVPTDLFRNLQKQLS